jgi:hypothetical protein
MLEIWRLLLLLFSSLLQTENLKNHLFLFFNFASKKKRCFWGAQLVELNTKSEKGYARPGKEIVQPTIPSYNHTLVVQQQSCLSDHKRNGSNFTVNSYTQLSSHVPCKLLLCCLFNHPSVFLATHWQPNIKYRRFLVFFFLNLLNFIYTTFSLTSADLKTFQNLSLHFSSFWFFNFGYWRNLANFWEKKHWWVIKRRSSIWRCKKCGVSRNL